MPDFIQGIYALLSAMGTWLLYLVPVAAGLMVGYHSLMKGVAGGDWQQVESHNRAIKNTIIAAVVAVTAVGFVKIVLSFFG